MKLTNLVKEVKSTLWPVAVAKFSTLKGICINASLMTLSVILYSHNSLPFQTGHTALQRAAAEGHLEIIKTLVKNGVSVDHQDEVVSSG